MRGAIVLVGLLLASVVVPAAAQQAGGFYDDVENDTQLNTFGLPAPPVPVQSAETAPADLRRLDVQETDDAIVFTLGVQSLHATLPYRVTYQLAFEWSKVQFTVYCGRYEFGGQSCAINSFSEEEGYLDGAPVDSIWDDATSTVQVPLRKVLILDEEERTPTKGDVLKSIRVRSYMPMTSIGFFTQVTDQMPDDREKSFPLQIGDFQSGNLHLSTQDRVRVSNGGATTFVFQINLTNSGEDDVVRLEVQDVPHGWNVTLQSPIDMPARISRQLALLVSVPFGHDHGGYSAFNLTAKSERDPGSRASLRMGILHTPVPQPAGHHDELFLHATTRSGGLFSSVATAGVATMNTVAPTDEDAPEAAPSYDTDDGENGGFVWEIPLEPALGMGLDFDLSRLGNLKGKLNGHLDGEATLSAELYVVPTAEEEDDFGGRAMSYDLGDGVLLATSDSAAVTLTTNGQTDFELALTPTDESDYIPYAPRQNLVLVLEAEFAGIRTFCCIDGSAPTLDTKSFLMKLPLNEYHDRLTGLAEAALAVDLRADGPVEKYARPGSIVTYIFHLTNPTSERLLMDVDVAGNNADVATVVPDGIVELPPQANVKLTLAVEVPRESAEGQELEVLIFAHAVDDPSKTAVARTKTVVSYGSDAVPDETDVLIAAQEEAGDNDSPGLGALGALAAVGLAAAALRRRRG